MAIPSKQLENYLAKLNNLLGHASTKEELFEAIVNAPFQEKKESALLGLGIVVFMLVNKDTDTLDRIALSKTEQAQGAVDYSVKRFKDIKIPLGQSDNIIIKAINNQSPQMSADWRHFFVPALSVEEAHLNQAGAGIGCSVVYPLLDAQPNGGAMTYSFYLYPEDLSANQRTFMNEYSKLVNKYLKRFG